MATPLSSPPPHPESAKPSSSTSKKTRKETRLVGAERPMVHVDRRSADVTYDNWKQVHAAQKDLICEDI